MTSSRQFADLATDPEWKAVYLNSKAQEAIANMRKKVGDIGAVFGQNSKEYREAATSLMWCLSSMLLAGFSREAKVTWDGEHSLFVQEGGVFVYGIIFHQRDRETYPDGDPRKGLAGEWSMHS